MRIQAPIYVVRSLDDGLGYVIDARISDGNLKQLVGVYTTADYARQAIKSFSDLQPDRPRQGDFLQAMARMSFR